MFTISLYEFGKDEHSTGHPFGTPGRTYQINLKQGCDIINPVVSINFPSGNSPTGLNYAYIPEFKRYYYINNWRWDSGLWWAFLRCDALASWRDNIINSEQYVSRAEKLWNGIISDMAYPTVGLPTILRKKANNYDEIRAEFVYNFTRTKGWFVIGIINKAQNTLGAVSYYVMNNDRFRDLCSFMLGTGDYLNIESGDFISPDIAKSVFNPFQYIASCMWLPYEPYHLNDETQISFGWWDSNITGHRLRDTEEYFDIEFTPDRHPQAEERGDYLCFAPYAEYNIVIPYFGKVPVDSMVIGSTEAKPFTAEMTVSNITGEAVLFISDKDLAHEHDTSFGIYNAQIGVNVQLAQIANDVLGAVKNAVNTGAGVASAIMRADVVGGISSTICGIIETAQSLVPKGQMMGNNGSPLLGREGPWIEERFLMLADEDMKHVGRPLMQFAQLRELFGGFVRCTNARCDFPGITETERAEILRWLELGVILE